MKNITGFSVVQRCSAGCLQGRKALSTQERSRRVAIYPGSFDPLTNGHLDIARRAARIFDTLVVSVYAFPAKNVLFTVEERLDLLREVISAEKLHNVHVDTFTGLTVEYVREQGGLAIIK